MPKKKKKLTADVDINQGRNVESFNEFARGVYDICSRERSELERGEFDMEASYKKIRALYLNLFKFQLELKFANQLVLNQLQPHRTPEAD